MSRVGRVLCLLGALWVASACVEKPTFGGATDPTPDPGLARMVAFDAVPGDRRVDLTWELPNQAGVTATIVRREGAYPTTLTDGDAVVTEDPQATSMFTDSGLINSHTYYYAAFAVYPGAGYATPLTKLATMPIAGSPDPDFNNDHPLLPGSAREDGGRDVVVLPNGNLVAVGRIDSNASGSPNLDMALWCFGPELDLCPGWSNDLIVHDDAADPTHMADDSADRATGVTYDGNAGRIYIAGVSQGTNADDVALWVYDATTGQLDSTFNGGAPQTYDHQLGNDRATGVAMQGTDAYMSGWVDPGLVQADHEDVAVAVASVSGTAISAKTVNASDAMANDGFEAVAIEHGLSVFAGYAQQSGQEAALLVPLSGTQISSTAFHGPGQSHGFDVMVLPDGTPCGASARYVMVGRLAARMTVWCITDDTLAAEAVIPFTATGVTGSEATGVLLDDQNRILVVGRLSEGGVEKLAVWRFFRDLSPDPDFGPDGQGWIALEFSGSSSASIQAVALDGDGKIVITGTVVISGVDQNMFLWRLLP